jgi:hypothetical protein
MPDIVTQRNIGALIVLATSVQPQSASAGAVNGGSIDRFAHSVPGSCVLHSIVGAVSGAPSATSVITKLQHAPDNSTWTDYKPDGVNVATIPAITAATTEASLNVDLTLAARYIRAVSTVSFSLGTTPAALIAADVALGGEPLSAAV